MFLAKCRCPGSFAAAATVAEWRTMGGLLTHVCPSPLTARQPAFTSCTCQLCCTGGHTILPNCSCCHRPAQGLACQQASRCSACCLISSCARCYAAASLLHLTAAPDAPTNALILLSCAYMLSFKPATAGYTEHQAAHLVLSLGFFAPYLDREVFLSLTPAQSSAPRITL